MASPTFLNAILACLCGTSNPVDRRGASAHNIQIIDEKPHRTPHPAYRDLTESDAQAKANDIVTLIRTAEKRAVVLAQKLDDVLVGTEGWTEWIAEKVLTGIETILREGRETMGPVMTDAYSKACAAANEVFTFAHDHPIATAGLLTIIAVGVLVLCAPMVVEALGFSELGPVEGSFAAGWQSLYGAWTPKGSLFSFLQRLGMVWGRA